MNKDEKLQITKDKLLESTYELMVSTDDPMKVTSREIANKAGVKASMINYCFESRENLIYNVFLNKYMHFLKGANVEKIISSNKEPIDILKELHFIVAKCLIDNYAFTKAITGYVLFKRDLSKESFSFQYVYKHYEGQKSEKECKLIAYELSTMMQLIVYRKDDLEQNLGINLHDDEELRNLINMRVDLLLGGKT